MSKLSDLGPAPYLGYTASMVERAAELRTDGLALAELQNRGDARAISTEDFGADGAIEKIVRVDERRRVFGEARGMLARRGGERDASTASEREAPDVRLPGIGAAADSFIVRPPYEVPLPRGHQRT